MKFYIESTHYIYEDHWFHGESKMINEYTSQAIVIAENIKKALKAFYDEVLHYKFRKKLITVNENGEVEDAATVDIDRDELDEANLKLWREGRRVAYSDSFMISIYELRKVKCEI